jgi:hypothetical protein
MATIEMETVSFSFSFFVSIDLLMPINYIQKSLKNVVPPKSNVYQMRI